MSKSQIPVYAHMNRHWATRQKLGAFTAQEAHVQGKLAGGATDSIALIEGVVCVC